MWFFFSKASKKEINAARVIQAHYRLYKSNLDIQKQKLIESMENRLNSFYCILNISDNGNIISYKDYIHIDDTNYNIDLEFDNLFLLNERKRIKAL